MPHLAPLAPVVARVGEQPTGAAFDVVLLAHVAAAVIGFGAIALTGVQAWRAAAGPGATGADSVRRYFRPGVNWAGRTLYLVPVLGFALIAMSRGQYDANDPFVVIGLALWFVAAGVAEVVVWPGERRIQRVVTAGWEDDRELARACRVVAWASWSLGAVFVAATVVMVARP